MAWYKPPEITPVNLLDSAKVSEPLVARECSEEVDRERELLLSFLDYCRRSLGSVLIMDAGTYYWEELGVETTIDKYMERERT